MSNHYIPHGRGMQKFLAFASMPEQFEGIKRILQEQTKVKKPILDEQQKEEIERILWTALQTQCKVNLWYFHDGHIYHEIVRIQRIDGQNRQVLTTDTFPCNPSFSFDSIVDCQLLAFR